MSPPDLAKQLAPVTDVQPFPHSLVIGDCGLALPAGDAHVPPDLATQHIEKNCFTLITAAQVLPPKPTRSTYDTEVV